MAQRTCSNSLAGSLLFSTRGFLAAVLLVPAAAYGQVSANDPSVQRLLQSKGERLELIVRTKRDLTTRDVQGMSKLGAFVYRNLPIIRSVAVSVPKQKLGSLLRFDFVERVSADGTVHKTDAFTEGATGAPTAWNRFGLSGRGIGIAIVDSGIRAEGDLGSTSLFSRKVVASANFAPDQLSADDTCGHGTHVAGIAAGTGRMSSGPAFTQTYYGIAPGAHLLNVRVLDSMGGGKVSQVIAGISWVVANKALYNVRVMNLSIGHEVGESYKVDPLCLAVEAAWKSGIVVVVAAGNTGRLNAEPVAGESNGGYGANYGSIQSPGNSPYVITVGAMKRTTGERQDDTIATYSSRGPTRLDFVVKPDIVAPGNGIVSSLSDGSTVDRLYSSTHGVPWKEYMLTTRLGMSSHYFRMSGTSMAAPVVSGAAALLLEMNPRLTPDMVKARLMISADKWVHPDGTGDVFTYGAGYLNIPAALVSTAKAGPYAVSPTAQRRSDGNVVLDFSQALLGGSIWDSGLDSGDDLYGNRAMWGTGGTVYPNRAMWGTGTWNDSDSYEVDRASAGLSGIALKGDG